MGIPGGGAQHQDTTELRYFYEQFWMIFYDYNLLIVSRKTVGRLYFYGNFGKRDQFEMWGDVGVLILASSIDPS